ncbi:hypothetical protein [Chitinophaga sp. sic0106]|uniref:hypothetical protein n=1 Tax=Chitinophaga sp. sic0106 TaxID=2854785 RepID=UPI002105D5F7|nr:hypothetical protein [Chitinophaga sp. sic0106]
MKKIAIGAAALGILIALSAFVASTNSLIGIKTFFRLGLGGLGLMMLASAYFLVSSFLISQMLLRQKLLEME